MWRNALRVPRCALNHLVVIVRNANKHPKVGAFFKIEHQARVFDCLPRCLEEQPVLRIDIGSFTRRDVEKVSIELVDAIDEAAAPRDGLPDNSRLRIIKALDIPPIRRHLADGFAALDQEFPKRFGVIDSAGKSATDSDDSNAVLRHLNKRVLCAPRPNDPEKGNPSQAWLKFQWAGLSVLPA